jgi:aldose 1-epimerase
MNSAVTISGYGLAATILPLGARIADLTIETAGGPHSVVLGYEKLDDYAGDTSYLGCVAGRCANRIAGGRFELDGKTFQLPLNDGNRHHLHGGPDGFSARNWTVEHRDDQSVTLSLVSPDGDQGYPGTVRATCTYEVSPGQRLSIRIEAVAETPTLVNLATHSYFALDDTGTILDHCLTVPAEHFTPAGPDLIPTGEIALVADTPFDFRRSRPVRFETDGAHLCYDHNFAVYAEPSTVPRRMAALQSPITGIALEVWSTEPGLQIYDGNFLPPPHPLRGGRPAVRHGGLCLEPQRYPDAIHHPNFAGAVLRPGETYRQITEYRFAV